MHMIMSYLGNKRCAHTTWGLTLIISVSLTRTTLYALSCFLSNDGCVNGNDLLLSPSRARKRPLTRLFQKRPGSVLYRLLDPAYWTECVSHLPPS